MPMGQLAQVLRGLGDDGAGAGDGPGDGPGDGAGRLLVGPQSLDDAGVVRLGQAEGLSKGHEVLLVQTVDYFPPVVDDPYMYGAIAAANALSDVYAMGGRPFCALNLAGFPKEFPEEWVRLIIQGGFDKVRESGAVIAGGHTVQSAEAMFGFAVTGIVSKANLATNAGARIGDVLYLTKALGMGALTTGAKSGAIAPEELSAAAEQMATLNARPAEAMNAVGVHACTDITGFGLLGHARNIAAASGLTLRIRAASLPVFPGALELARRGVLSGAAKRSRASLAQEVRTAADIDAALAELAFDAETSGGLLMVLEADRAAELERELEAREVAYVRIGECVERVECIEREDVEHGTVWIDLV